MVTSHNAIILAMFSHLVDLVLDELLKHFCGNRPYGMFRQCTSYHSRRKRYGQYGLGRTTFQSRISEIPLHTFCMNK